MHLDNFPEGCILNQIHEKEGIKRHEEKAVKALLKKFTQLCDNETFESTDACKLSHAQKRRTLNTISVIKEKRYNLLK